MVNAQSIRAANAHVSVQLRHQQMTQQMSNVLRNLKSQINRAFPASYGPRTLASFSSPQAGFASRLGSASLLGLEHGAAIRASRFGGGGRISGGGGLLAQSAAISGGIIGAQAVASAGTSLLNVLRQSRDFEETLNKFRLTFRELSSDVERWADRNAAAMQRAKTDLLAYSAQFQNFFVGFGFGRRQAAEFSKQLTKLSIDLGSFHNVPDEEAARRLFQGLAGSTEALDIFGINAREARIKEYLGRSGIQFDKATANQKVLARLNAIIESTRDAQGDAEKTANSFANSLRGLSSASKELAINLGLVFTRSQDMADATGKQVGVIAPLIPELRDVVFGLSEWVSMNEDAIRETTNTIGVLIRLRIAIAATSGALTLLGTATSPLVSLGGIVVGLTSRWIALTSAIAGSVNVLGAIGGAASGIGGVAGAFGRRRSFGAAALAGAFPVSFTPGAAPDGGYRTGIRPTLLLPPPGPFTPNFRSQYATAGGIPRLEGPVDPQARASVREARRRAIFEALMRHSRRGTIYAGGPGQRLLGYSQGLLPPPSPPGMTQNERLDVLLGIAPGTRARFRDENLPALNNQFEYRKRFLRILRGGGLYSGGVIPAGGQTQRLFGAPSFAGGALATIGRGRGQRNPIIDDLASAFRGPITSGGPGQLLLGYSAAAAGGAAAAGPGAASVSVFSRMRSAASGAAASISAMAAAIANLHRNERALSRAADAGGLLAGLVGGGDRSGRAAERQAYRDQREADRRADRTRRARIRLGRIRGRSLLAGGFAGLTARAAGGLAQIGGGLLQGASAVTFGALSASATVLSGVLNGLLGILAAVAVSLAALPLVALAARFVAAKTATVDWTGAMRGMVSVFQSIREYGVGLWDRITDEMQRMAEWIKRGDLQSAILSLGRFLLTEFLQVTLDISAAFESMFTGIGSAITNGLNSIGRFMNALRPLTDYFLDKEVRDAASEYESAEARANNPYRETGAGRFPKDELTRIFEADAAKRARKRLTDATNVRNASRLPDLSGAGDLFGSGVRSAFAASRNFLADLLEQRRQEGIELGLRPDLFGVDTTFGDGTFRTVDIPGGGGPADDWRSRRRRRNGEPIKDEDRLAFSFGDVGRNLFGGVIPEILEGVRVPSPFKAFSPFRRFLNASAHSTYSMLKYIGEPSLRGQPNLSARLLGNLLGFGSTGEGGLVGGGLTGLAVSAGLHGAGPYSGSLAKFTNDIEQVGFKGAFQVGLGTASKAFGRFIGGGGILGAINQAGAGEVLPGAIGKVIKFLLQSRDQAGFTSELISSGSFSGRAALFGASVTSDPSFTQRSKMLDELVRIREAAEKKKAGVI